MPFPIVLIITGRKKALALSKCIEEGVNHLWTVSAIQLHPWALVVCDTEATMELRVKTVAYFKGEEIVWDHYHSHAVNKVDDADDDRFVSATALLD